MRQVMTFDQMVEARRLQGNMTTNQIAIKLGLNYGTLRAFLYKEGFRTNTKQNTPRATNIDDKIGALAVKLSRTRAKISSIQVGNSITLQFLHKGKPAQKTGTVTTVWPEKFVMRNKKGRLEMITFADLLAMQIKCE